MFFAQDVQLNDIQSPAEITGAYQISYSNQDSAVINFDETPSAIYKHEPKKPKIIAPQTTTISPVAKLYAEKLRNGTAKERKYIMDNINFTCNKIPREAIIYTDSDITDGLFAIINEDTTNLQKPSKRQLKLRKEFSEGKKLSQKQIQSAISYSESEIAEQNKILAFYTLGTIQNLSYKIIVSKTGIKPKLHDSPITDKIIYEAQNNKNENLRAAALGTLHVISKPEYDKELKPVFQKALNDNSKIVRDMAQESLQYIE